MISESEEILHKKIDELEDEVEVLEDEVDELEDEVKVLEAKVERLSRRGIEDMQARIAELEAECRERGALEIDATATILSLKAELARYNTAASQPACGGHDEEQE